MGDLAAFRTAVRSARRTAGHTQRQLARAIGLHPDVLSHKLNGHEGSLLTNRDVLAIVATLVEWGAVATPDEADALLQMMRIPPQVAVVQPWHRSDEDAVGEGGSSTPLPWRWAEEPSPPRPAPLPQPVTPFVGRAAEVAAVIDAVQASRLVTLTGAGGTGKTRLALEAAGELAPSFPDGVAFADLAPLTDPALIGVAIGRGLGLDVMSSESAEAQLTHALTRAQLLLVVDNVEHLVEGSGLLGRLLTAAPGLKILASSRRLLRLYGERQHLVPPLQLPVVTTSTPPAEILENEAVQLFLARARDVSPGLEPEGAELREVAAICTALDGLPLAIELAAAQVRLWSMHAIRDQLDDRLSFLTEGARDLPSRHRSLRETLEWSDAMLHDTERQLFLRLGVFAGSFDAAAAAAVGGRGDDDTLEHLARLTEHSLLKVVEAGSKEKAARFRMLTSVREYALLRLGEVGELESTRRAHLRYYVALATSMDPHGLGPHGGFQLDTLQADYANINAALNWACTRAADDVDCLVDGMRLATAVARVWERRASIPEGRTYLKRLLDTDARTHVVPAEIRAAALVRAALLSCTSGEMERAVGAASECLELSSELGDHASMSWAHNFLGEAALAADDTTASTSHFTAAVELARRGGDREAEADALNMLGQTFARLGRYREAEDHLTRSLAGFEEVADVDAAGAVISSLAELACRMGDPSLTAAHSSAALRIHWETGNRRGVAYDLELCAMAAAVNGLPVSALRYVIAAMRLRASGGWVLSEPERDFLEDVLGPPLGAMSSTERDAASVTAARRGLADVVEQAISELHTVATTTSR